MDFVLKLVTQIEGIDMKQNILNVSLIYHSVIGYGIKLNCGILQTQYIWCVFTDE